MHKPLIKTINSKSEEVAVFTYKQNFSHIVVLVLTASLCHIASGVTVAFDDASQSAYVNGWQAGDNGGVGFGPWSFAFSGNVNTLLHPPQFIDTVPLPANSLGAPAFALTTGDQNNQFETSEVQRTFLAPLAVGQTFHADVNGSAISNAPSFTTGNTFDLLGSNGSERFSLFTNNGFGNNHWISTGDADTGIPAANQFHLEFTLVDANTYNLTLSPLGGGLPYFTQTGALLGGTTGVAINRLRISAYGTGSSTDGSKELFFDNLSLNAPDMPGDFNHDNKVDAADYVVWRNNGLDASAYGVWKSHFGESSLGAASVASSSGANVPEPAALLVFAALEIVHLFARHFYLRHR